MKLRYKTKLAFAAIAAFAASLQLASAAFVEFPDLSGGGNFTLNAGDTTSNTSTSNVIADQATSVLTINGAWDGRGANVFEIQVAGVNYQTNQSVTINLGSTGSMIFDKGWIGDGPIGTGTGPGANTVFFNMAAGATWSYENIGQFYRWNPPTGASSFGNFFNVDATSLENAFNEGMITNTSIGGTYAETFSFSDNGGGSWTLTALPEPSSAILLLGGAGMLAFMRRRRR